MTKLNSLLECSMIRYSLYHRHLSRTAETFAPFNDEGTELVHLNEIVTHTHSSLLRQRKEGILVDVKWKAASTLGRTRIVGSTVGGGGGGVMQQNPQFTMHPK